MKKTAILVSLLIGTLLCFGQNDEKAKQILDQVSAKTKSYSTINVKFDFVHENVEEDMKENTAGELSLKGNKYLLGFMNNTIICDSKTIWTYMKDANEVNISTLDEDEETVFNPAKMLTIYETGFKYKFIQERFEAGHALYIIDLYPVDVENSDYSRVRLEIDKDKNQIHKINYFSKDENRFIIMVKEFTINPDLNDSLFTFDKSKYPGVEVVDMRE